MPSVKSEHNPRQSPSPNHHENGETREENIPRDFFSDHTYDLRARMDQTRREWEKEVERMRQNFGKGFDFPRSDRTMLDPFGEDPFASLRSRSPVVGGMSHVTPHAGSEKPLFVTDKDGNPKFQIEYDANGYTPEDIALRTEGHKLIVHGKREEVVAGSSVNKEFTKQCDLPQNIDPNLLRCIMQGDKLIVEAPMPAPGYEAICGGPRMGQVEAGPPPPRPGPNPPQAFAPPPGVPPHFNVNPRPPFSTTIHTGPLNTGFRSESPQQSPAPPVMPQMNPQFTTTVNAGPPQNVQQGMMPVPVIADAGGAKKFKMVVDIEKGFGPEDITVKTVDKRLVVNGKREIKQGGSVRTSQFNKEFDLPNDVDPLKVGAFLSEDGKLTIEAPL